MLSLEGFGLAGRSAAATAAGAVLHYVRSTQRGTLDHVDRIGYYERQQSSCSTPYGSEPRAGRTTLRRYRRRRHALLPLSRRPLTPMGKRLLRAWMLRPSIDAAEIQQRLDTVQELASSLIRREELRRALDGIFDIERLLSRVTLETANARDVLGLAASLAKIPPLRSVLARFNVERLRDRLDAIDDLSDLRERIETTIVPEPPLTFNDGGVIASGVDAALDELRVLSRNSKQYLAQVEERERLRTGIGSLKVKFNSVFGYYIEISKSNLHHAPADYDASRRSLTPNASPRRNSRNTKPRSSTRRKRSSTLSAAFCRITRRR